MQTEHLSNPAELLAERFGFAEFRQGQREVIEKLLTAGKGRALAVFPTGSGKSLCYQLPALALPGLTLVVSPLIALMKDQIGALRARGISAARLDSSLTPEEMRYATDGMRDGSLKLLYVAPERFNNERFLELLKRTPLSLFAVDEAHCISEWGHNFRPDYLKLAHFARQLQVPRILTLTATATPKVVQDICRGFEIPPDDAVLTGVYRHNLTMLTTPVSPQTRNEFLIERLKLREPGPTIVYVTLQKTAEQVAAVLNASGLPAEPYHAGMETPERTRVQEWWTTSNRGIAVATIAFGMGIDKADVRYVYHYNLPKSLENYSQEIGRAGRDDKPSIVEMFVCADDLMPLENFAYGDTPTRESLHGLITELLSLGDEFDVSLFDLSSRHDLRQAVLRTALTYLELKGILQQGTPFYGGYEFRPLESEQAAVKAFDGEYQVFVERLFKLAKKGKTWYRLNADDAATQMKQPRQRIVRALEVMEERRLVVLKVAELRHRFSRVGEVPDIDQLADQLTQRFENREVNEVRRLRNVLQLARLEGCQVNALCKYFGEERTEPCGHCTFCQGGKAVIVPEPRRTGNSPADADRVALGELERANPGALSHSRQVARFMCGISSPAIARARLGKHPLFGKYDHLPFTEVLKWAQQ
ncbi:MAG: RecQ family ATP-dependent DNA helicase [Candidatus Sumerlaeaceae bacterium]